MRRAGVATYLYCVVRGRRPTFPAAGPRGLPAMGRPRALEAGDGLWLVAADAPLDRYGGAAIERRLGDLDWVSACAVAHEEIVEACGRTRTVLPVKLFTLFASDERALEHVRQGRRRLERVLARVAGRQEWGLRVAFDDAEATKDVRRAERENGHRPTSGTVYLLGKRTDRDARVRAVQAARAEADALFRRLARHADDTRRRTPVQPGGRVRMLLDCAFLVARERLPAFRAEARASARRLSGRGYRVTLTGPWPPYNFAGEPS